MKTTILITILIFRTLAGGFSQTEIMNFLVIKSKTTKSQIVIPEGKKIKVTMADKESFSGPFRMCFDQETGEFTRIIIKGDTLNITNISKIKYNKYLGYGVGSILSGISISAIGLFIRPLPEKKNTSNYEMLISNEAIGDIFIIGGLIPIGIGGLLIWPSTYSRTKWYYTFLQKKSLKRSLEIYPY